MTQNEIGWESLIQSDAPANSSLKAALFTTYDRPDERFLVENLLPELLKLNRAPVSEGSERKYFLVELDERLKSSRLHGKIVIVSSTSREIGDDAAGDNEDSRDLYGWIWRSIRHRTVGSTGHAVQHAKLWLLHWESSDEDSDEKSYSEFLEIVVTSANLTRAAFTGQIQTAWRTLVKLDSQEPRRDWGVLPAFLRELAKSAGDENQIDSFIKLLARADCPKDATFVASIPGTHSQTLRQTAWGIAGLREIAPPGRGRVSVSVLSPFVGSWCEKSLQAWCDAFDGTPNKVNLLWVSKAHSWAENWVLPQCALQTFKTQGSTLIQLLDETADAKESTSPFHDEHDLQHDKRWSHAKLYFFTREKSRRMLLTSANFSPAAWGRKNANGDLFIENFELGVCITQPDWPFDELDEFQDWEAVATASESMPRVATLITWAQAAWDGKQVVVECRCDSKEQLKATIRGSKSSREATFEAKADPHRIDASVPWTDQKDIPAWAELTCEAQTERVRVPIFDARPSFQERADRAPPELDPGELEAMRDALLFEQYGGHVAGDERDVSQNGQEASSENLVDSRGMTESYDVPAFVAARWNFDIVDNWVSQWEQPASESDRQALHDDGLRLIEAFRRQQKRDEQHGSDSAISAKLAAEELGIRIEM